MKQWKSVALSTLPWVLLGIGAIWAVLLKTPIMVDALDMFTSDGRTFRNILPLQLWFYLATACALASFSGAMLIQVSQCRSLDSTIPYWHAFRVTLQMVLLQAFIVTVCLLKHYGQDVLFVFPSPIPLFGFIGRVGFIGSGLFLILPFFLPLIHAGLISPTTSDMGKPDYAWLMSRFGCFLVLWNSLTFISLGSANNYLGALAFLALLAVVTATVLVACYGRDLINDKLDLLKDALARSSPIDPDKQPFTCPQCRGRLSTDFESVPNTARAALDNGTIPDSLLCGVFFCKNCGYKRRGDPLTHIKPARIDHL